MIAKAGIISRSYAAGLERHVAGSGNRLITLADHLGQCSAEADELISELRSLDTRPADIPGTLRATVDIHGRFQALCRGAVRNGNSVRSWVSKYLHFHGPAMPIYDSRARAVLTSWYPLRGADNWHFDPPEGHDPVFHSFANRFCSLWLDAKAAGLDPTPKVLDQYALYCQDTGVVG